MEDETKKDSDENVPWLPGNETQKRTYQSVKNKENEISLDFTGKKPGRGAYICKNVSCLRKPKRVEN